MASCQKLQNLTFKVNLLLSKIIWIFLSFFFVERYLLIYFLLLTFLTTYIFKTLYFLKWCLDSTILIFTKYNNFLGVCLDIWLKTNLILYPSLRNLTTHSVQSYWTKLRFHWMMKRCITKVATISFFNHFTVYYVWILRCNL